MYNKLGLVSIMQPMCYCPNLFDLVRLLWGLNPPTTPHLLAGAHLGYKDSDKKLQP